jgi:hypothetical protein
MKPARSLLVSWLLGATVVALVTFSFEALSEREVTEAIGPASASVTSVVTAHAPASPAATQEARCPATGATAHSATVTARCPVGATAGSAASSDRCPATGATATPPAPTDRCPAGGNASGLLRPGLRV